MEQNFIIIRFSDSWLDLNLDGSHTYILANMPQPEKFQRQCSYSVQKWLKKLSQVISWMEPKLVIDRVFFIVVDRGLFFVSEITLLDVFECVDSDSVVI